MLLFAPSSGFYKVLINESPQQSGKKLLLASISQLYNTITDS